MTKALLWAAALTAGIIAGSALAADPASTLSAASQTLLERFKQADTNGDANVTKAEWEALLKTRFALFDTSHDGKLSADEIGAMLGSMSSTMTPGDYLKQSDKDGDGAVSQQEYVERLMERFDFWDQDKDGILTKAEQDAEIARMEALPR
jgi:Ca2+-binding EF-hand superfamily protein